MQKFPPNVPSPLVYKGVLYIVKDGGILTALNPETGRIFRQGRLEGAIDTYYSSPVAAAGKVYAISQGGKLTVPRAGADREILATNDLGDQVCATLQLSETASTSEPTVRCTVSRKSRAGNGYSPRGTPHHRLSSPATS